MEVVSELRWCDADLIVYVSKTVDHVEFDQAYQSACGFRLPLFIHICLNGVDDVEMWDPADLMAVNFIVLLLTDGQ